MTRQDRHPTPSVTEIPTLLLTLGATPQVVTETVYALAMRAVPFVPADIHLITTLEGSRQAQLRLLAGSQHGSDHLGQLFAELGEPLPNVTVHIIEDIDGQLMEDIRSIKDQDQAANQILSVVRVLTADSKRKLHVSLAGGRKTMGFYLAYALSLYGREADELSHVLVNAPFENLHDFFYPPSRPQILQLRDGKTASTADARIMLAPIPYVRLRGLLPVELIAETCDYRELVRRTQTRISGIIELHREDRRVIHGDTRFKLTDTQFTWLYWFALRAKDNKNGVQVGENCKAEILACARALVGVSVGGTRLQKIEQSFDGDAINGEALRLQISRLNAVLRRNLGPRTTLQIIKEGPHSQSRYRLAAAADDIRIHA